MPFRRERLRVETLRHVIEGVLQLPTEGYRSRVTDYMNAHDSDFIALTDVVVHDNESGAEHHHEYVAVNMRHALIIVELEDLGVTDQPIGPIVAAVPSVPPPPSAAAG
jgi:hypothetical protein